MSAKIKKHKCMCAKNQGVQKRAQKIEEREKSAKIEERGSAKARRQKREI
jgi:hypothetical protein